MDNIQIILTVAIPIYSLFVILAGVWLGHKLTMKAFAHVQPSVKDMIQKAKTGSVSQEDDWFEEAMKDPGVELSEEQESDLEVRFKESGIPDEILESYKRAKRNPADFFGYDTLFPQGSVDEEFERIEREAN